MKKKIIVGLFIIIIAAAGIWYGYMKNMESKSFETMIVEKGDYEKFIKDSGSVKSRNQREIIYSGVGKIEKVNYSIGEKVKKGSTLIAMDVDVENIDIQSLYSRLKGLEVYYEQAKRKAENNEVLYNEGALSLVDYQDALDTQKQYAAQISELRYNIAKYQEVKKDGLIRSPIDGVVTELYVEVGESIIGGNPLIEISDTEHLYVEVEMLASEIVKIKEGNAVVIEDENLNLFMEGCFVGKIYPKAYTKLSDLGIEQKRVKVEIIIPVDNTELRIGYDVDVKIHEILKFDIVVVNEDAVFEMNGEKYVYQVEENIVKRVKIETGIEFDEHIEVIEGVSEGAEIIVNPDETIEEGVTITKKSKKY